jgi:hypothetical protein
MLSTSVIGILRQTVALLQEKNARATRFEAGEWHVLCSNYRLRAARMRS